MLGCCSCRYPDRWQSSRAQARLYSRITLPPAPATPSGDRFVHNRWVAIIAEPHRRQPCAGSDPTQQAGALEAGQRGHLFYARGKPLGPGGHMDAGAAEVRVAEQRRVIERAIAQQPLRVDRQPAARAEIEHVVVVQVAVQRPDLLFVTQHPSASDLHCSSSGGSAALGCSRSANHLRRQTSSAGGALRGRCSRCRTWHRTVVQASSSPAIERCRSESPLARSIRIAGPSWASKRAAPSPSHQRSRRWLFCSSASLLIFSIAGAPAAVSTGQSRAWGVQMAGPSRRNRQRLR